MEERRRAFVLAADCLNRPVVGQRSRTICLGVLWLIDEHTHRNGLCAQYRSRASECRDSPAAKMNHAISRVMENAAWELMR